MCSAQNKEWYLFLSVTSFIVTVCLLFSDLGQRFLHAPDHARPHYSWPAKQVPLRDWERDTQKDYAVKFGRKPIYSGPTKRFFNFNISEITVSIAGVERSLIAINGLFPGPLIEAEEGDTLIVRVCNQLPTEATSIHFHGMLFNGTNFYDGAVGITQCGIAAGKCFTYEFIAEPFGTFWYHSHQGTQALKGLIGPMVIHPKSVSDTAEPIDQDHVLLLSDLYDRDPAELMELYQEPWLGGDTEPVPGLALVQGKQYARVKLEANELTRLRIINAASYTTFKIELGSGSQPFTVIEADGTLLKKTELNDILVFPAQRYSILVQLEKSEWLHTSPQRSFYDPQLADTKALDKTSTGLRTLLEVSGPQDSELPFLEENIPQVKETNLREPVFECLQDNTPLTDPAETIYLNLTMSRTADGVMAGAINDKSGVIEEEGNLLMTAMLTYVQRASGNELEATSELGGFQHQPPSDADHYSYLKKSITIHTHAGVVDLVIQNFDDGVHPMHIHGHPFWIMARGSLSQKSTPTVYPSPLVRDVVALPQNEWVRLRVTVKNPGVWSLHCHIAWHGSTGMRIALMSQPHQISRLNAPAEWWNMCK